MSENNLEKNELDEYGISDAKEFKILSVIGEIEGHDNLGKDDKTTKYEHMLPLLAQMETDRNIKGILFLINTVGGDVSAGLAIAEMIAGMRKPTVALVVGDSHSIGVPIAVAADYSFIVPTATMILHPVRMSGTVLGTKQTFYQFHLIQERIVGFVAGHCGCDKDTLERMMMETTMIPKDLGTVLVGEDAVRQGIINAVGGISDAVCKLKQLAQEQ